MRRSTTSSRYEGLANALVEAIHNSKRCIVSFEEVWPIQELSHLQTPIAFVRLALTTGLLPPITYAMGFARLLRAAVMATYAGLEERAIPPTLSGHGPDGPLQENHRHAYFLGEDCDRDGLIDHLSGYRPGGFSQGELSALWDVRRLYGRPGESWDLGLDGIWTEEQLADGRGPWPQARTWESATALVLQRYPKRSRSGEPRLNEFGDQRDGPEDAIRTAWSRLLAANPVLPGLLRIERMERLAVGMDHAIGWSAFRLEEAPSSRSTGLAFGLRLHFERPFCAVTAFGFGQHQGLGLFLPSPACAVRETEV